MVESVASGRVSDRGEITHVNWNEKCEACPAPRESDAIYSSRRGDDAGDERA